MVAVLDEDGRRVAEVRVGHGGRQGFDRLFGRLDGPVKVVYESGFNWSWLYEILETIPNVVSITLANPYRVRLIAEAQIKTDKIDARKLAMLLRLDVVPACHVPLREVRDRKQALRQRAFWVGQRTRVRNRIHKVVDRQHDLAMPQVSDLFGKKGRAALAKAQLPESDAFLLEQDLRMLDALGEQVRESERRIRADGHEDPARAYLQSIPGIGLILANVIATETDGIERFSSATRYVCYAGLAPQTRSSGGRTYTGRMVTQCNKWLKWAFVEAAWVAVGCSAYFGGLYRAHRARGKKANTAITIVARRMCRIVWQLLREDRHYEERAFEGIAPAALVGG
jgi:transposase